MEPFKNRSPGSLDLFPMESLVGFIRQGTRIQTLTLREFNPVEILDIGAVVQLSRMAGSKVFDQKSKRSTVGNIQRLAMQLINQNPLGSYGFQRNRDMKIVAAGMKGQLIRIRQRFCQFQERFEGHGIALFLRFKPRNIQHLIRRLEGNQF